MAEIKARGPVACGVAVTNEFMQKYKGGVFEDTSGEKRIRHVVSLLGGVAQMTAQSIGLDATVGEHTGVRTVFSS